MMENLKLKKILFNSGFGRISSLEKKHEEAQQSMEKLKVEKKFKDNAYKLNKTINMP